MRFKQAEAGTKETAESANACRPRKHAWHQLMLAVSESGRFITDSQRNRLAAILDIEQYETLLDAVEELEDIRAFDEAKASKDEAISFEQAIREIEQAHR